MAMGDIGTFLPTETAYRTPGAYDQLLSAEATKRANYLASMDQFYAQLDESIRQFNETLNFKEEYFDWEKESFKEEMAYKNKALAAETMLGAGKLALESRSLDIQEESANPVMQGHNYLGGPTGQEQFEFLKGQQGNTYDPLKSATEEDKRFIDVTGSSRNESSGLVWQP